MTYLIPKRVIEYYDYFDMRDHVKGKYNINEEDYSGTFSFNWIQTCISLGADEETATRLYSTRPSDIVEEEKDFYIQTEAAKQSYNEEHPYQNFWHFLLDYIVDFKRGAPFILNWGSVYRFAREDWQREIAQLYINEFGEQDYTVIVEW